MTTDRERICRADIWATAQALAGQRTMRLGTTNDRPWVFSSFRAQPPTLRTGTPIAIIGVGIGTIKKERCDMEKTFMLPNGVQAAVMTTEPPAHATTVRFGKDVPVLFYVSNAEAIKRVICRFAELSREEREGIC
jgi:hypothetical protein